MKIMVIDGNSILNRAFYGIRQLTNHEGLPTNAVYGFLATLFKLQDEEQPDRTIVCFDVKEKTFRHLKFDTYKATRKGMPDELAAQHEGAALWSFLHDIWATMQRTMTRYRRDAAELEKTLEDCI